MKRKLLRQLRNEWRANIWLCLELLIVSVVIWYIADFFFVKATILSEPDGWGTKDNVFVIDITHIPEESPEYKEPEDGRKWWETYEDAHVKLVERLRTNPDIESVAIVGSGGRPYDSSWSTTSLKDADPRPGDTINIETLNFDKEDATGDIPVTGRRLNRYVFEVGVHRGAMSIFDIRGLRGETPEELEDILERGDILLSETAVNGTGRDPLSLIGHEFYKGKDTTRVWRVGAIIPYLNALGDYEGIGDNAKFLYRDKSGWGTMVVRVRPGLEDGFADRIMAEADNYYRVDNIVIDNIQLLIENGDDTDRPHRLEMRNWFVCLGFLLVSIFLGVLGTFWFRTQQRMNEMAIRKAFGADRGDLFRRLICEGLLLLVCATVPAAVIDYLIADNELNTELYLVYMEPVRMAITIIATFLFMAMMIVLGTLFPAWRAMKVDPARVLADE